MTSLGWEKSKIVCFLCRLLNRAIFTLFLDFYQPRKATKTWGFHWSLSWSVTKCLIPHMTIFWKLLFLTLERGAWNFQAPCTFDLKFFLEVNYSQYNEKIKATDIQRYFKFFCTTLPPLCNRVYVLHVEYNTFSEAAIKIIVWTPSLYDLCN